MQDRVHKVKIFLTPSGVFFILKEFIPLHRIKKYIFTNFLRGDFMAEFFRLKKLQKVDLADGTTATVTEKLGEGGQGIVYRVRLDATGEEKALKWYFIGNFNEPKKFYNHLAENIKVGSPSNNFVWPEKLTAWNDNAPFGYIMPIMPKNYESFSKFLNANVNFKSANAMVDAALNIVLAFKALHNKGYNYQDLNDGNFSIDPNNGKILICDNDNVMGHGQYSGIEGKARYKAPEIVRGESQPDKLTDRYSLAVILFRLFIGEHPLEGSRTNVPALTNKYDKRFFGEMPLFIFDKNDKSNAPVPGLHRNAYLWNFFPSFIKDAFQQSFSQESLLHARGRLLEQDWFNILMRLKSSIVKCPQCGEEIFMESDRETVCKNHRVKPVGYLKFAKRSNQAVTVPIIGGAVLYKYHVDSSSEDFKTVAALVREKPGKFGLKNETDRRWQITAPNGKTVTKQPGETPLLGVDFKIDFGNNNIAQVVVNQ